MACSRTPLVIAATMAADREQLLKTAAAHQHWWLDTMRRTVAAADLAAARRSDGRITASAPHSLLQAQVQQLQNEQRRHNEVAEQAMARESEARAALADAQRELASLRRAREADTSRQLDPAKGMDAKSWPRESSAQPEFLPTTAASSENTALREEIERLEGMSAAMSAQNEMLLMQLDAQECDDHSLADADLTEKLLLLEQRCGVLQCNLSELAAERGVLRHAAAHQATIAEAAPGELEERSLDRQGMQTAVESPTELEDLRRRLAAEVEAHEAVKMQMRALQDAQSASQAEADLVRSNTLAALQKSNVDGRRSAALNATVGAEVIANEAVANAVLLEDIERLRCENAALHLAKAEVDRRALKAEEEMRSSSNSSALKAQAAEHECDHLRLEAETWRLKHDDLEEQLRRASRAAEDAHASPAAAFEDLAAEREQLQAEVEMLRQQYTDLEEQLHQKMTAVHEDAPGRVDDSAAERDRLVAEAEKWRRDHAELEDLHRAVRHEKEQLLERHELLKDEHSRLVKETRDARDFGDFHQVSLMLMQATKAEEHDALGNNGNIVTEHDAPRFEARLDELQDLTPVSRALGLGNGVDQAMQAKPDESAEGLRMQQAMAEMEADRAELIRQHELELSQAREEHRRLADELDRLTAEAQAGARERADHQKIADDHAMLAAEAEKAAREHQARIAEHVVEGDALKAEITRLQDMVASHATNAALANQCEVDADEHRARADFHAQQHEKLQAEMERLAAQHVELGREVDVHRALIREHEAARMDQETELARLRDVEAAAMASGNPSEVFEQAERLAAECDSLGAEVERLGAELALANSVRQQCEMEVQERKLENHDLAVEIDQLKAQMEELRSQFEHTLDTLRTVAAERDEAKELAEGHVLEIERHRDRVDQHVAERDMLQAEASRSETERALLESDFAEFQNKHMLLAHEHQRAQAELDRFRVESTAMNSAGQEAALQVEELQQQISQQSAEREALEAEVAARRAETMQLEAENQSLHERLRDASGRVAGPPPPVERACQGFVEILPAAQAPSVAQEFAAVQAPPAAQAYDDDSVMALAAQWVSQEEQGAPPLDGTPRRAYGGKTDMHFADFADSLRPVAVANEPSRPHIAQAVESGDLARVTFGKFPEFSRDGFVERIDGKVGDFVAAIFLEYGLSPPTAMEMQQVENHFGRDSGLGLDALECLWLVDALVRSIFTASQVPAAPSRTRQPPQLAPTPHAATVFEPSGPTLACDPIARPRRLVALDARLRWQMREAERAAVEAGVTMPAVAVDNEYDEVTRPPSFDLSVTALPPWRAITPPPQSSPPSPMPATASAIVQRSVDADATFVEGVPQRHRACGGSSACSGCQSLGGASAASSSHEPAGAPVNVVPVAQGPTVAPFRRVVTGSALGGQGAPMSQAGIMAPVPKSPRGCKPLDPSRIQRHLAAATGEPIATPPGRVREFVPSPAVTVKCSCGNLFMEDSVFCRRCGQGRPREVPVDRAIYPSMIANSARCGSSTIRRGETAHASERQRLGMN